MFNACCEQRVSQRLTTITEPSHPAAYDGPMFTSLFKKFSAFRSRREQSIQEPSSNPVAKYGIEKICRSAPDLVSLFRQLDSVGDSRLKGPVAWSVSDSGSTMSTLWKKESSGTRRLDEVVEEADWNTRLGLALQVAELGALFPHESVVFLEQARVLVEKDGRCILDTMGCLRRTNFHLDRAVIFRPNEAFWLFASGFPVEHRREFLLSHWVATRVLSCLFPGHQTFEGILLWGARAFYQRLNGISPSGEPSFQEPEGLPTALATVLGKMLSFDPEQRYPSTEAALSALREALLESERLISGL